MDLTFGGREVKVIASSLTSSGGQALIQQTGWHACGGRLVPRTSSGSGLLLVACNPPDGRLGPTFGTAGCGHNHRQRCPHFPVALIQQPDGKLVVGGVLGGQWNPDDILLGRYLPDGRLDPRLWCRGPRHH